MPLITRSLLLLNVGIYLYLTFIGFADDERIRSIYEDFGLVPLSFLEGSFWQPLSSMFLHFPYFPLHLFVNMLGLWSFGSFLEKAIGPVRFLWLYLIAGLFGSLFVVFIPYALDLYESMTRPTVGASGALMGLLGAVAVLCPRAKLFLLLFPMRARTAALILAIASLLMAILDSNSFISHNGHLGGILAGFFYAKFALLPELQRQTEKNFLDTGGDTKTSISSRFKHRNLNKYFSELKGKLTSTSKPDTSIKIESKSTPKAKAPFPIDEYPLLKQEDSAKRIENKGQEINPKERDGEREEGDGKGKRLVYDPSKKRFYYLD